MTLLYSRASFPFSLSSLSTFPLSLSSHSELGSAVQILGEEVRAERSARAAEMEELDKRWEDGRHGQRTLQLLHGQRRYLWELDNLHSILFDGAAQVLSRFALYVSLCNLVNLVMTCFRMST